MPTMVQGGTANGGVALVEVPKPPTQNAVGLSIPFWIALCSNDGVILWTPLQVLLCWEKAQEILNISLEKPIRQKYVPIYVFVETALAYSLPIHVHIFCLCMSTYVYLCEAFSAHVNLSLSMSIFIYVCLSMSMFIQLCLPMSIYVYHSLSIYPPTPIYVYLCLCISLNKAQ